MTFPASLPDFSPQPTGTDFLSDVINGRTHSQTHAAEQDAILEIATALTAGSLTVNAWTPTFNNAYGTIPTIGSGSANGFYVTVGPLFVCSWRIIFGAGATAGTGIYSINPPVSAYASSTTAGHGAGSCSNGSAQLLAVNWEMYNGLINGIVANSTNAQVGAGVPSGMGSATNTPSLNGTLIGRRA